MSKTAKKDKEMERAFVNFLESVIKEDFDPVVFNTMRILKKVNPGDCYYENYLGMRQKYGSFLDLYHVLWHIGTRIYPKRILEIGTRTGISLCQLLSSYIDLTKIERVVCVDPFDKWTSANLVRANLKYLNIDLGAKLFIASVTSDKFFENIEGATETYDFILVDGDHTKEQAFKDLENAHKILEKNGLILMDDISTNPGECALRDVWDDFHKAYKNQYAHFESMEGKGVAVGIKI